jgi:hypothetical protein
MKLFYVRWEQRHGRQWPSLTLLILQSFSTTSNSSPLDNCINVIIGIHPKVDQCYHCYNGYSFLMSPNMHVYIQQLSFLNGNFGPLFPIYVYFTKLYL